MPKKKRSTSTPKRRQAARQAAITRATRHQRRSEGARRGWITRRRNERLAAPPGKRSLLLRKIRQDAARRGWETRRARAAAKFEPTNQEYLIEIRSTKPKKRKYLSDKKGKGGAKPDLFVIFDREASDAAIVAFAINWLLKFGGDNAYLADQLSHGDRTILIARGPLTTKKKTVKVRFY